MGTSMHENTKFRIVTPKKKAYCGGRDMLEGANNPLTRAKGSKLPEIAAVMS